MTNPSSIDVRLAKLSDVVFTPLRIGNPRSERRDVNRRIALLTRIQNEFVEMPGTCLTVAQAARLFSIPRDACARMFLELAGVGKVQITSDGRYRLSTAV